MPNVRVITDPVEAERILSDYYARRRAEAEELIKDMPVVQAYVEQNRPRWQEMANWQELDH